MLRRIWPLIFVFQSAALFASSAPAPLFRRSDSTIEQREQLMSKNLERNSQFAIVTHTAAPRCEEARAPQELMTPNPLLTQIRDHSRVRVSFIIGTDGLVHSPLILESAGPVGDRSVLRAVRTWKFRPAMCNGVPTEMEGKIEFSTR